MTRGSPSEGSDDDDDDDDEDDDDSDYCSFNYKDSYVLNLDDILF